MKLNFIKNVLIFCLLFTFVLSIYAETENVAKVNYLKGTAYLIDESGKKSELKINSLIPINSTILTEKKSKVILTVKEIGKVEVNENSILKLDKAYLKKTETHLSLIKGSAKFQVSKLTKDEKLNLFTPTAVVGVRGTEYEVQIAPDGSTAVNTSEGIVEVKNEQNSVELSKGESCESPVDSKDIQKDEKTKNLKKWVKSKEEESLSKPVDKLTGIKERLDETAESQQKINLNTTDENSAQQNLETFRFNCCKSDGLFEAANLINKNASANPAVKETFDKISELYSKLDKLNKEIDQKFKKIDLEYEAKLKKIEKKFEEQEKKLEKKLEKYK